MRRMNYNPLNNVYASGEYNHEIKQFVLDKNLEENHVYYLKVLNGAYSYGPAILDFRNQEDFTTSIIAIKDASDTPYTYSVSCEIGANVISISNINKSLDAGEEYLIYIYQLM